MQNNPQSGSDGPTIRDLYPELNEAELKEAEENLDRYLALVLRIYERVHSSTEGAKSPGPSLTDSNRSPTLRDPEQGQGGLTPPVASP